MSSPLELLQEFERELTYRGVDYRKSQFQSLRAAIEAQAEELAQARARIARLTDVLKTLRYPAPDKYREMIGKIINEFPAQSLAAVRAEVLREARDGIDPDWTGMDAIVAIDDLIDDYEETERESKESG